MHTTRHQCRSSSCKEEMVNKRKDSEIAIGARQKKANIKSFDVGCLLILTVCTCAFPVIVIVRYRHHGRIPRPVPLHVILHHSTSPHPLPPLPFPSLPTSSLSHLTPTPPTPPLLGGNGPSLTLDDLLHALGHAVLYFDDFSRRDRVPSFHDSCLQEVDTGEAGFTTTPYFVL